MVDRRTPRKPPVVKVPKDPDNPSPQFGRTYPADHLRRDEIMAMLAAFDAGDPVDLRNRTLMVVLWRSGLRISEALALTPNNVDLVDLSIRVLHGKGDKARTANLDPGAARAIREWLPVRATYVPGIGDGGPLFCTSSGKRVIPSYVRAMLPRMGERAGVTRRVHAHGFRHSYAVELMREGVPVAHIQRLLGHSNLATTTTYLASIAPEEALNMVRGREW